VKLPHRRNILHLVAGAGARPALSRAAIALDYPVRPVHLIVFFAAGGGNDIIARLMGQWLSERLGQQFVIENRPGGGGNIGTEAVVRATPDGYTLLLISSPNTTNGTLYEHLDYDFSRDIAPVASISREPNVMVVNPLVPAKTVPEFIAYAKANPGKIKWGSQGFGTAPHLLAEMFKLEANVNILHVPYRGTAPMLNAILANEVQMVADPATTSLPYIQDGKLRAIAIAGETRDAKLPDVPTVVEAGFPKLLSPFWLAVVAPAGTPPDVIAKLNGAFRQALGAPETRARLDVLGAESRVGSPEDLDKMLAAERARWSEVVKAANIKME
jgi:tripartite-type tricarboxylate transporter receptor subunit TctC